VAEVWIIVVEAATFVIGFALGWALRGIRGTDR
jgi:hypothetical protein